HAPDLQRPLVTLGDAFDHVGDQRTGQAVQGLVKLLVAGTGDDDLPVFHPDLNRFVYLAGELALGSLDLDGVVLNGDLDTIRNLYGHLADAGHRRTSSSTKDVTTKRSKSLRRRHRPCELPCRSSRPLTSTRWQCLGHPARGAPRPASRRPSSPGG